MEGAHRMTFKTLTDEERVKAAYPDADIAIDCIRSRAWFVVIRTGEKDSFWTCRKSYGRGDTMRLAWADAAEKLGLA